MLVDVSDLFDDLFAVAAAAEPRFPRFDDALLDLAPSWEDFCHAISDTLFLPACAIEPDQPRAAVASR